MMSLMLPKPSTRGCMRESRARATVCLRLFVHNPHKNQERVQLGIDKPALSGEQCTNVGTES